MSKKSKVRLSKNGRKAEKAMKQAMHEVIREHRLRKIPIAVWKNGRVVKISPNKIKA